MQDFETAINLFAKDEPAHLMKESQIGKFDLFICPFIKLFPDPERTARFVCAVACVLPGGEEIVVRDTMEGRIGYEERGENGFGYDPIFRPDGYSVSSGELPMDEKNEISHRGKAFRKMWRILTEERNVF